MYLCILLLQCLCICPDTFESNNIESESFYLGDSTYAPVAASISPTGDIDWFEFEVSSVIKITFKRKNLNYHFRMRCSDGSGIWSTSLNIHSTTTFTYAPFLPKVTCRLYVYGVNGLSNPGCYYLYIE